MSLHEELRAGGTPFDRTRSLSRGLSGERCGRVEEMLERVKIRLTRGVDPAANLERKQSVGRQAPARSGDETSYEPEPVTLCERRRSPAPPQARGSYGARRAEG